MVAGRIQAVELTIQHVGEGREGIPITIRPVGQSPPKPGQRQAGGDVRICVHESAVVVPEELVAQRLAKDEANGQQKETADGPNPKGAHPSVGWPRTI